MMIAGLVVALSLKHGGASLTARSVAGVVVWWAILSGSAFSLVPRARISRLAVVCAALLVAFALFSGLSGAWAPSAERAYDEMTRVLLYAGALLVPILFARRGDAGRWADGLALAVAIVGVLALAQRMFPELLPADELAKRIPAAAARLTFPLGYWNGLAIFLALGVPLLLRSAVTARALTWRFAALLPLPVMACAIYLTSSRGGAAVALVAAVAFALLAARRLHALLALLLTGLGSAGAIAVLTARPALVDGPFKPGAGGGAAALIVLICAATAAIYAALSARVPARLRVPAAGWIGAAVLLAAAIVAANPAQRLRAFKAVPDEGSGGPTVLSTHLTSGGGSGRWQFWSTALDQFSAHPLAGGGAGSYEPYWAQHGSIDWFVRNAHSLWLETAGELGLIGVLLLAGVFVAGLLGGVPRLLTGSDADRTTVAALVAVVLGFVLGAALDWVWQLPVIPLVALASLGLLVGPATRSAAGQEPARVRIGARVALAVGAGLAVLASAVPFLAAENVDASRRAARRGDLFAAIERARSAREIEPWASSPRVQLALVDEEAGRIALAQNELRGAIQRDEADWRLRLIAARLAVKAGDVPAARRALAQVRRLNPRSRLLRTLTAPQ